MDYTNKGTVWKNQYKEKGDKKPDFKGIVNVEGKEYEIAQWYYPEKGDKKACFSIQIQPKQDNSKGLSNDDLPF
jgi:hypothetical protein